MLLIVGCEVNFLIFILFFLCIIISFYYIVTVLFSVFNVSQSVDFFLSLNISLHCFTVVNLNVTNKQIGI